MAGKSVLVLMTLSDGIMRGIKFQVDLLNNAGTIWCRTTKFGKITHVGRVISLGGQPHTIPQGLSAIAKFLVEKQQNAECGYVNLRYS